MRIVLVVAFAAGCAARPQTEPLRRADVHLEQLQNDCNTGDSGACESLGEIYLQLEPPDVRAAEQALARACGNAPSACASLGTTYKRLGRGAEAQAMFARACAGGWVGTACQTSTTSGTGAPGAQILPSKAQQPSPSMRLPDPGRNPAVSAQPPEAPRREPKLVPNGLGTCFAASADGTIATANHVIDGASVIGVRFGDERWLVAKVLHRSDALDLAVLKIDRKTRTYLTLPPPTRQVSLGERVFTIGFPKPNDLGLDPKFAEGSIAATTVNGNDHEMQVQIPIYPGNSGGALVSEDGFVVGVVARLQTAFLDTQTVRPVEISYAVKASYLAPMLNSTPPNKPVDRSTAIKRVNEATCLVATLVWE